MIPIVRLPIVRLLIGTLCVLTWGVLPCESATLAWDPPITNTDGSPLTDLDGYHLYFRLTPTSPWTLATTIPGGGSSFTLSLQKGQYMLRAVNVAGQESDDSNLVDVKTPSKVTITSVTR